MKLQVKVEVKGSKGDDDGGSDGVKLVVVVRGGSGGCSDDTCGERGE